MFSNIYFIGGIHGVGKSVLCKNICNTTGVSYLSASEVIKWSKAAKEVDNIDHTQNLLLLGLQNMVEVDHEYLLDGHYCLLNSVGEVERIPIDIFVKINPVGLGIVIDNVESIKLRLEARDGKIYHIDKLNEFQKMEMFHAQTIANLLKIKLTIFENPLLNTSINSIKNIFL